MKSQYPPPFLWLFAILFITLPTACNVDPVATGVPVITSSAPAAAPPTLTATPPLASPSATAPPSPTSPSTPTLTPTPEHPLMIEVMRRAAYPGSELIIEAELEAGENYRRFTASYLSEGHRIVALLAVPGGPKPASGWPIIVLNHGLERPDTYDVTLRYSEQVDYFARSGYIVFHPAYRGHGDSEGQASNGTPFNNSDYTIDTLNGMAAVRSYPDADPERVGMWGHSMGGFITLRAMVVSAEIDAGVIWSGVVGRYPDLFAWAEATATAAAVASPAADSTPQQPAGVVHLFPGLERIYGSPEDNPAFWSSISAAAYLGDISGPLQLHHALNDSRVPVAASILLQAQMEAAGRTSELHLYGTGNHSLGVNFDAAMSRTLAFFDQHVKAGG